MIGGFVTTTCFLRSLHHLYSLHPSSLYALGRAQVWLYHLGLLNNPICETPPFIGRAPSAIPVAVLSFGQPNRGEGVLHQVLTEQEPLGFHLKC